MNRFTDLERDHYNSQARQAPAGSYEAIQEKIHTSPLRLAHRAWEKALSQSSLPPEGRILDYCCGQGQHTVTIQKFFPKNVIHAVDISEASLEKAETLARQALGSHQIRFQAMDAHKLQFDDHYFDLIVDYGSFSSLDFSKALGEIDRVLAPGGEMVAIETFGHHPLANLKRQLNVLRGKRTRWAAEHILNKEKLAELSARFKKVEVSFFGLSSLCQAAFPTESFLKALERFDDWMLRSFPGLKPFCFKAVIHATKA